MAGSNQVLDNIKIPPAQAGDTISIWARFLKAQHNANDIPNNNPVLRLCLAEKYALARNTIVDSMLTSLPALETATGKIRSDLKTLERVPDAKLSVNTFNKELDAINQLLASLATKHSQNKESYQDYIANREKIITQVLERLVNLPEPDQASLAHDSTIQREFARLSKVRTTVLTTMKQYVKEVEKITEQAVDLDKKVRDRTPPEQRTAPVLPNAGEAPHI